MACGGAGARMRVVRCRATNSRRRRLVSDDRDDGCVKVKEEMKGTEPLQA